MKVSKLQKIIDKCIVESIHATIDDDWIDILEDVKSEFHSGQKHQSWKLVPARDLKLIWAKFAKYGRVDESSLKKIWDILRVLISKLFINSDIKDGVLADSFFEKENYKDITEEEWERWFTFISDKSGSKLVRNFGEIGSGGNGRYSDRSRTLYKMAKSVELEHTPEGQLLKIDQLLNFIHGLGSMAHWFVEGGESTLDDIRDYQAKGIVNTGTISEKFLDSFESNLAGKSDYVEVFINPTPREIKEITKYDQYGLILSGNNAYGWDRDKAYHYQVRKFLKNKVDNNYVCLLVYVEGDNVSLLVTDDTKESTLHHNPKTEEFIYNHPFFKHKNIIEVLYWDQDVVGSWKDLVAENITVQPKVVYHVTPKKNIPNMKINGILPKPDRPAKFCSKAVYLFDDRASLEDALMNWLSDKFDEDEPLVILTINTEGLELYSSGVGYEIYSCDIIPWNRVTKIEDV